MKSALQTALDRIHTKLNRTVAETDLSLEVLQTFFQPETRPCDLYVLLTCWLIKLNRCQRPQKKLDNARQAGAILFHYICRRFSNSRLKKEMLDHFGGDGRCAFQNYGAGKKVLAKLSILESHKSKELNDRFLKSWTNEQLIAITARDRQEQLRFFRVDQILEQNN